MKRPLRAGGSQSVDAGPSLDLRDFTVPFVCSRRCSVRFSERAPLTGALGLACYARHMPCIWSTAANTLLRGVAHHFPSRHGPRSMFYTHSQRPPLPCCRPAATSASFFTSAPCRTSTIISTKENDSVTSPPKADFLTSSMRLTAAQLSRASAQAVRLCAQEGHFGDALYVVNSLHYSVHPDALYPLPNSESSKSGDAPLQPINFGRPVSPRLSAHAFLHGLLRAGYGKKAAQYAQLMIGQGISLRTYTLESIIRSLSPIPASLSNPFKFTGADRKVQDDPAVLKLRMELVADDCTQAALQLLHEARVFGQHRTKRMYDAIISTALMQGEIIVGSLLFVLLVKDWQLRNASAKSIPETDPSDDPALDSKRRQQGIKLSPRRIASELPYPDPIIMGKILRIIKDYFSSGPDDNQLATALQALANLAALLDTDAYQRGRTVRSPTIKENAHHGITVETVKPKSDGSKAILNVHPKSRSTFPRALQRLDTQVLALPNAGELLPGSVTADAFTLSSYIISLTSTGRPAVVADVLFHILPELYIIDHPSWGSITEELQLSLRRPPRRQCLQRAVAHGPYVFSALLNALSKAGNTGLAERVWILAKQAERASWIPDFAPGVAPWCLTVHAYTSMLQCYAAEARKSIPLVYRGRLPFTETSRELEDVWVPKADHHKRGWARFVVARRRLVLKEEKKSSGRRMDRKKHNQRLEMGLLLYRSMLSGGRAVYDSLLDLQGKTEESWSFPEHMRPIPDPRFFNAALSLFGRHPDMYARASRSSRAYWRRRLRTSHLWYHQRETVSPHWTPLIQEVAETMVASGLSVPAGFRHLFVGRWLPGTMNPHSLRLRLSIVHMHSRLSQERLQAACLANGEGSRSASWTCTPPHARQDRSEYCK
ncbi:hypothetical protein A0H81_08098 [Grifola frondosa]|uniref:Uncharacterized protein n=1 Tax=Grifola frondosa TaxID=5627 RepID=A0A1C7M4Y8_GRIFR|nr:hypothetical protein A0H81_08098 [Grifola frondosa]